MNIDYDETTSRLHADDHLYYIQDLICIDAHSKEDCKPQYNLIELTIVNDDTANVSKK
jgi:hypothetical protein